MDRISLCRSNQTGHCHDLLLLLRSQSKCAHCCRTLRLIKSHQLSSIILYTCGATVHNHARRSDSLCHRKDSALEHIHFGTEFINQRNRTNKTDCTKQSQLLRQLVNPVGNKVQSINNELHIVGLEQVLSHTNPCFFQCIQLIIQRLRNLVHLASRAAGALFHLYDSTTRLIKVGQNRGTNLSLPFTEQSLQKVSSILIGQLIPDIRNIGQNVIGRTISLGIVRLKQTDTPVIIACDLSKIGNRTGQFGHICGVFLRLLIIATDTH